MSLLKQNAEMTGGSFRIESELGKGTQVTVVFGMDHPDRPVTGDLVGTLVILICSSGETNYVFKHQTPAGEFELDSSIVKQELEDVPLTHPDVRIFLREMIQENLELIEISKG